MFQAILGMLSAIKLEFFHACYMPLGDLMDDIALLNSSINFVIYYFMSRQFRKNFLQTFGLTWCQNCTQDNAAANQLLKKDEHEMRPLMGPKSQGQPLVPRRPQIIIGDHQTAMVESLPDSPQVMQVTEKSANYVLKRTNEPSQQI